MKRRGSSPGAASLSAHRALNVLNEEAENNPQFQGTQLWNRITRKFCKDVPRKRHRRNIRFYDDTFTGKEAIDFLLGVVPSLLDGNRDVTRAKCILLAEKFFENDIIRHFRGDHLIGFKDSAELYELSPAGLEIGKSARPFRRASSFNERKPKQTWPQNLNVTRKIEPLPSIVIRTSQICKDQTLTEEKRKRCLRTFQQTCPEIYKERFPPSNSPPAERRTPLPRFLNKLRNMKLKN
ncbi:hypothetical protein QR680_003130 [Steinernema hermaphroditum]|uniref:DEP domain-containing protein n=1 Tax=Steinernema hermaphroditum TaxID=289476 RepID=A0AA39H5N2_9BILA|nr:hypothetical protein QR680_003130 [Steinernema hermaphroditum]